MSMSFSIQPLPPNMSPSKLPTGNKPLSSFESHYSCHNSLPEDTAKQPISNTMFTNVLGQGRVNQLGGVFINGRPLPPYVRLKIIELASAGIRPCVISRQLRVSHGCVSKILQRYTETGTISPGQVGGNKHRITCASLEKEILRIQKENPNLTTWDIREKLLQQTCSDGTIIPSVSTIDKILENRGVNLTKGGSNLKRKLNLSADDSRKHEASEDKVPKRSFSITSLLGISDDEPETSSKKESESPEATEQKRRNRTSFTPEQQELLEQAFRANRYPEPAAREKLAKQISLDEAKIQVWFSNRRARWRKHLGVNVSHGIASVYFPAPHVSVGFAAQQPVHPRFAHDSIPSTSQLYGHQ